VEEGLLGQGFGEACFDGDGGLPGVLAALILNFSLNFRNQLGLVLPKHGVEVVILVSIPFFREAVHVELTDEGVHVAVLEVDGEDDR
jgi:hypothetical protein